MAERQSAPTHWTDISITIDGVEVRLCASKLLRQGRRSTKILENERNASYDGGLHGYC